MAASGDDEDATTTEALDAAAAAEHEDGDVLPGDLDVSSYVGPYTFPDIRRRRIPAAVYFVFAAVAFALWLARRGRDPVLVNGGVLAAAIVFGLVGWYHLAAAWPLRIPDGEALAAAAREVGFPVGHASAQLGWRGLRSRPTWRVLLYSSEEPPARRALVLVDAVAGDVVAHFVEDNPEEM